MPQRSPVRVASQNYGLSPIPNPSLGLRPSPTTSEAATGSGRELGHSRIQSRAEGQIRTSTAAWEQMGNSPSEIGSEPLGMQEHENQITSRPRGVKDHDPFS